MPRFEQDTLKSVFAYHIVEQIVAADGNLDRAEVDFLQRAYPLQQMVAAGLARESGEMTPLFLDARDEALQHLPQVLSLEEKFRLVSVFIDACVIDGELHATEGSLLFEAAMALGITPGEFDSHLDSLTEMVGSIDLPEPEVE